MEIDVWILRETTWADIDVVGYAVEAIDGEIGKVDRATYDVRESRIVVDTGPWIFGRKVILPAGKIDAIDTEARTVRVAATKDQIRDAPAYDDENLDEEEQHLRALSRYWGGAPQPGTPPGAGHR